MTLSPREKYLAMAVGGIVLVVLNIGLLSAFARKNTDLRAELATRKMEWSAMQQLLEDQELWAKRNAAIDAKQPKMGNENAAGVELLDTIRGLAKSANVTLENPSFGAAVKTPWARVIPVTVDTRSTWPDLVTFLRQVQQPDQFIVIESASMQVDPGDATKMRGHFRIARWFAP